jgi:hypothetical protein
LILSKSILTILEAKPAREAARSKKEGVKPAFPTGRPEINEDRVVGLP